MFDSFNSHNHEQPPASPAPTQHIHKTPGAGDDLKSQSDSSPASLSVQESSRSSKRIITKYHSSSRVDPQIAPSQAQESSFHPIVPKTPFHHACKLYLQAFATLMPLGPKNTPSVVYHLLAQNHDDKHKSLCSHLESGKGGKRTLDHWQSMGGSYAG